MITSYSDLKTQVVGYLHRPTLASDVAGFISRAESMIFRELDIKALEVSVEGTTAGASITLPVDYDRVTRVSVTYAGIESSLDYFAQPQSDSAYQGPPNFFSLEEGVLRLHDVAGTGYEYKLYYIPKIEPLSESVTTNWLLQNADDLYLYASALEGARFVRNAAEVASLTALVPGLLDSVRRKAQRRAIPAGGSLQIKPRRN